MTPNSSHKSDCLLCGQPLVYFTDARPMVCAVCGNESASEAACAAGHFVCNNCHSSSGNELIEKVCIQSESVQPVELAIELMKSPLIAMHGPEHVITCHNRHLGIVLSHEPEGAGAIL